MSHRPNHEAKVAKAAKGPCHGQSSAPQQVHPPGHPPEHPPHLVHLLVPVLAGRLRRFMEFDHVKVPTAMPVATTRIPEMC